MSNGSDLPDGPGGEGGKSWLWTRAARDKRAVTPATKYSVAFPPKELLLFRAFILCCTAGVKPPAWESGTGKDAPVRGCRTSAGKGHLPWRGCRTPTTYSARDPVHLYLIKRLIRPCLLSVLP